MLLKHLKSLIPELTYELNVLKRDTERYKMVLYQHSGVFYYTESRIGNEKTEPATFESLFSILNEKKPDLLLTPEYSFPLEHTLNILTSNNTRPGPGKLWAICGESITMDELAQIDAMADDDLLIYLEELEDTI